MQTGFDWSLVTRAAEKIGHFVIIFGFKSSRKFQYIFILQPIYNKVVQLSLVAVHDNSIYRFPILYQLCAHILLSLYLNVVVVGDCAVIAMFAYDDKSR